MYKSVWLFVLAIYGCGKGIAIYTYTSYTYIIFKQRKMGWNSFYLYVNLTLSLKSKFPVHLGLLFTKKIIELLEKLIHWLFQEVSSF